MNPLRELMYFLLGGKAGSTSDDETRRVAGPPGHKAKTHTDPRKPRGDSELLAKAAEEPRGSADTSDESTVKNTDPSKEQQPNKAIGAGKSIATVTDPDSGKKTQYTVRGYVSERYIHLGTRFVSWGDF